MKIVLTPEWFIGKDIFIEFFSFVVLIVFFILAFKSYRLNKNKNLLYLGIGFIMIAIAQIISVFTKLVLYYDIGPSQLVGQAIISSQILSSVDIFYYIGFFFQRFLTLTGLYVIYKIPREGKFFGDHYLVMYFIFLFAILSKEFYYLFYLTTFFLLFLILKDYFIIYRNNKFANTKILITAFSILAFAQIIYLTSELDIFFAVANTIELIGYAILLILIVMILKHGKEKKPDGDNFRYVGSDSRKRKRD